MVKLKFPLIKGKKWFFPSKPLCPWCRKKKVYEPHSMAVVGGGALLLDRSKKIGAPSERMEGFLDFSWHGAHDGGSGNGREIYTRLEIIGDVTGGQFNLYFCSTACLRKFLNACVDELDRRIRNASLKNSDLKKRATERKKRKNC